MKNLGHVKDFDFSQNQIDYIMDISKKMVPSMNMMPTNKSKLTYLLGMTDLINEQSFKKANAQQPSCSKGCSHCCSIKVEATELEAELVLDYCNDNNIEITRENKNTLEQQALIDDTYKYMFSPHKKCIFLGDNGLCKVYPVRPFACRNYFVFSDPKDCDTDERVAANTDGEVLTNFNLATLAPALLIMQLSDLDHFSRNLLRVLYK